MNAFFARCGALTICATLALHAGCSQRHDQPPQPTAARTTVTLASTIRDAPKPELALGSVIPELPVVLQDGFKLDLHLLKGKVIVLYFCAAVSDPACVRETLGLAQRYRELHDEHHVAMVGITREDAATHRAFISEHALPFDLASDPGAELAQAYGVPARGNYAPRVFLFGRDNHLRAAWTSADPEAHVREISATAAE